MSRLSDEEREAAADAISKYKEFHRYDPRQIGEFPSSFRIPTTVYKAGRALWVTYRSGKVDPSTLRKPSKPVSYIHEHDAGVITCFATKTAGGQAVDVPRKFVEVPALTRLGVCLGFGFGDDEEVRCTRPMPDLYTTPDGKCLLVVQSKKKVVAMMWGGGLGVFPRGIDG